MTNEFEPNWASRFEANEEKLAREAHLPTREMQHDNCGVGLVVAIDGTPSRAVVEKGIDALKAVWHRGAVDADGKTGDGAGIHVQIPQDFFRAQVGRTGHDAGDQDIGVGMMFLPRTDYGAQEACRTIVETELLNFGYYIFGWRQVPVDVSVIGEKANATRPEIEQIMFANTKGLPADQFERELYLVRRRIENAVAAASITGFYICSLSCRSVIYKGMFLAEQLSIFYPDLKDERFKSAFAIYHQRYSTNTFPTWSLAQPFRMLAHNGEINTVKGNVNWMKSHEIRMASEAFGSYSEDIKPIVQPGSSDSAALDAAFEVLVRAGRNAPMAKTMLIPEAWSKRATVMADKERAMYAFANSMMEPWDGPAAVAATDGRWVVAGLDRNGLRPLRYTVTDDLTLVVGSETGMVQIDENQVVEKGRVGPGELIGVDLETGEFLRDSQMKDMLSDARDFTKLTEAVVELDAKIAPEKEVGNLTGSDLRQHQLAAGFSVEDMELILHPMAEDAKEAIGSMGDDTPAAVLSDKYRPLSHFFRQNFSQVTNPPIDPLREHRVMSLKTRFGNLGNVLDDNDAQTETLTLESPVLSNGMFDKMKDYLGDSATEIDCTFQVGSGDDVLRAELQRVREEAELAVRSGSTHLILTDRGDFQKPGGDPDDPGDRRGCIPIW